MGSTSMFTVFRIPHLLHNVEVIVTLTSVTIVEKTLAELYK